MPFRIHYGMMNDFSFGYVMFSFIFSILIIIGLIMLARYLWINGELKRHKESALEILEKRYARGEINKEEFEDKKRGLS